jgi:hypothetical protein
MVRDVFHACAIHERLAEGQKVERAMSWAEIMAERHKEMKLHEDESNAFVRRVTEQLHEQQSAFEQEFDENEKRIFGLTERK